MANPSRFAGLIGALSGKKAAEDDKDPKNCEKPEKRDDESDEDYQKRLKEWEDSQDKGDGKKKGEGPKDTSDDDQDKNDDKAKKAQAAIDAARAEGEAAGIAAERSRWADTLASKDAAGRVVAACNLLADTDLTAAQVQKTLAALPAETTRSTLAQRQPAPTPAPAPDGGKDAAKDDTPKGFAARVAAAVGKVRPEKAK